MANNEGAGTGLPERVARSRVGRPCRPPASTLQSGKNYAAIIDAKVTGFKSSASERNKRGRAGGEKRRERHLNAEELGTLARFSPKSKRSSSR
jgi:hypothetical protein